MKGIAVYVEGGGDNASAQRRFRHGMNEFLGELKLAAERKNLRWKLVPGGSRSQTYNKFRNAWRQENQTVVVLLVDSEGPVRRKVSSVEFLHKRDGWDLSGIAKENVHLMVQAMETWIVQIPIRSRYAGPILRSAFSEKCTAF